MGWPLWWLLPCLGVARAPVCRIREEVVLLYFRDRDVTLSDGTLNSAHSWDIWMGWVATVSYFKVHQFGSSAEALAA